MGRFTTLIRWSIFLICCCFASCESVAANLELRLDFSPFKERLSTWVELSFDGSAKLISYSPHTLEVIEVFGGRPPAGRLDPELAERLWDAAPSAPGMADLRHDDLFSLRLLRADGSLRQFSGQITELAPSFRQDIHSLLGLQDSLEEDPHEIYFLRAKRLAEHQMRRLRDGGRYTFYSPQELPLPPSIWLAAAGPATDFHVLDQEEYDALQQKTRFSRLFYVITGERPTLTGFEVSVYIRPNSTS
jgi:hypothetical protein